MMEEWLHEELSKIELNQPEIVEYILSIVNEDDDLESKLEACKDFLEASIVSNHQHIN
jgi:hypothetical protein